MTILHALVHIDESLVPQHVDYLILSGKSAGQLQFGLMEWRGENICFCFAEPGEARPEGFEDAVGPGRTLSIWRCKSK